MKGIIWFRDDLRIEDNEMVKVASRECDQLLPVFVIDQSLIEKDQWGIQRMGPFRLRFLLESLNELNGQLKKKGSQLLVILGDPVQKIIELAEKYKISHVYASKNYAFDEIKQEEELSGQLTLKLFDTSAMFHPKDVPFSAENIPDVFTDFRKGVEKKAQVRPVLEIPEHFPTFDFKAELIPTLNELGFDEFDIDSRSALHFKGGSGAARDRLVHYFWRTEKLKNYKFTRNGLIGADYSSKFSPWLALGCISPRQIYHEVKRFEEEVKKNVSTYWLIFELIWRDYFRFVSMKYGNKLFLKYGIKGKEYFEKYRPQSMKINGEKLKMWKEGRTGQPFIDANMKELNHTGYMSNRGRQNVASYLVHHLGIDWRMGAAWFENRLIDYDPCSNYGNWAYVAGVGNDPRPTRSFNPELQSEKYDKKGEYQSLWTE